MQHSKRKVFIILILLALIIVGLAAYKKYLPFKKTPMIYLPTTSLDVGVKNYDSSILPPNIPSGLPHSTSSAVVTANEVSVNPLNPKEKGADNVVSVQSQRKFIITDTLENSGEDYMQYLKDNGYEVTSTSSPTTIALNGKKGYFILTVLLSSYGIPEGQVSVTVTSVTLSQKP